MQINPYLISLQIAIASIVAPASVIASDGQLEINQACAINAGCFTGDSPGFPVTITLPGSYRLTGNLDLSTEGANVSGITISAPAVSIDLGGFHIIGPTICTGSGSGISCTPSSTGVGSAGVQFTSSAIAGVVKNGIVRNMTNFGILSQATGLRVQDTTVLHNGRDGISSGLGSLLIHSVAIENAQDGIEINTGSVINGVSSIGNGYNGINGRGTGSVVSQSSVRNNGMHGFNLGLTYSFAMNNASGNNVLGNLCGGGICTARTRIYMTKTKHQGDSVLTACTSGFHVASHTELQGLASYAYDYVLGSTNDESGSGAPVEVLAWIRNGGKVPSNGTLSFVNCLGWTSSNSSSGTSTRILSMINSTTGTIPNPSHLYSASFGACGNNIPVWCIEGKGPD